MIRREIQLPGQPPGWLLISQVEHARISGVLAEHCLSHFDKSLREELTAAIVHHDDGWAEWEVEPQLDETRQRPLAFYELAIDDSLQIWSKSIAQANEIGPRAAWVVAKHFLALLEAGNEPRPPVAESWHSEITTQCEQRQSAWHSESEATEALCWLQLLDVMSLWLCGSCPGQGEVVTHSPASYRMKDDHPLATEFRYIDGHATMQTWRLEVTELNLSASGWSVPIRKYRDVDKLLDSRVEHTIKWTLAAE